MSYNDVLNKCKKYNINIELSDINNVDNFDEEVDWNNISIELCNKLIYKEITDKNSKIKLFGR